MINIIMPKMGESIIEGTILEWKKKVGDSITKDEPLLEISTDKVDSEVPAPASGILLEIISNVKDTVPVGDVIGRIGDDGETIDLKQDQAKIKTKPEIVDIVEKSPADAEIVALKPEQAGTLEPIQLSKRFYSPLVKSIARQEGIKQEELDSLQGSGRNGRVNKHDILSFLQARISTSSDKQSDISTTVAMSDKVETMSRMRKKIANHMVQSVQTSPHVHTTVEADVTNLVNIRSKYKDSYKSRYGVNLTFTPMILDCCIRTIQDYPLMNASLDGESIVHHRNINLGVAVALPDDNLIVPVIHSAEEKNFLGLTRSTSDLAGRARENNLSPDEIFGSTFTVTNPGVFGGLFGMGIINQPNVGILAVGAFQKRPVVKETEYGDTIVIRHMVYLTLSYDHRIIDGAYGTRFLSRLVEQLESYSDQQIEG